MRIVSLLEKNHSIYKKNKCIVNATFVAKELCENPSKNLYHKVTLALSVLEGVLEEYPRNSSVKSNSNVRSYAKYFVDFIYQNVGDNRKLVLGSPFSQYIRYIIICCSELGNPVSSFIVTTYWKNRKRENQFAGYARGIPAFLGSKKEGSEYYSD